MWGAPGWQADRNGLLQVIGAKGEIQIHSFPKTASAPVGKGLLNPGMCLTAPDAGPNRHHVIMDKIGPRCLKFKNRCGSKDPCGGALTVIPAAGEEAAAPQCLSTDAAPPPAPPAPAGPPCWDSASSVHSATMCDISKSPEERAKDLISRMTVEEKGHNMGGDGGWGGSSGVVSNSQLLPLSGSLLRDCL